ncbi:MAG: Cytochrome c biogenesis protein, transmembrane region, dsbD family [Parcubacteria group bacterium GW2011_GWD2_38_12]|nr:MAG: Cytochrome c biogenesis protein, transmembrane region, dsbD family [Parcubacteria group bacterium GW2011_GWC2_36_17]KKQ43474.1 MAG: Cytochrome c biogenesis protein, transmembrane region, dsbD family [Parcubacteria group bacterium GW2011_GWE2_37_8]KKQ52872.1 MAG: Cytochrome c biogenesis protein, transmembrane region, dsbD family [Parcubacteria group bacterium GW2011_GWD2_38_12]KKQ59075.1 MAG: Cytochrome c biogenesis protein, transmembrane region, dsbD family [Parcubacteria group bacterium
MNVYFFVASFFAGILTFFSSCSFILIPPFLGLISAPHENSTDANRKFLILKNTLFYVLGFSLIFILLGFGVGYFSQIFVLQNSMAKIGGMILVVMGLFMLGFLRFSSFLKNFSIKIPQSLFVRNKFNSFLLGAIFAFGWSPCIGPFLGSILTLAGYSGTALKGGILLLIFSLGMALPFIFAALLWSQMYRFTVKYGNILQGVNFMSGIFLVAFGVLLIIGKFYYMADILLNIWR